MPGNKMNTRLRVNIGRPVSIREKVYLAIRNDILNGRITPGERVIETRLAEQIRTSRTPVREALHMLELEGLLEAIPRVGYRVKELKWNEVIEICEIRRVNEILAARWAIKRITQKGLRDLEKNLSASEYEVNRGNPRSFVEYDAEFHEILVHASGSDRLLELCQLLRRHMLRYRLESILHEESVLRAIGEHRRIFDCIRLKDIEGADRAIGEHLESSVKDIMRYAFGKIGESHPTASGDGNE
jgi:DNA-binding GntR family transcriptional regulator